MNVTVNGEIKELEVGTTVRTLVDLFTADGSRGVAVAMNGEVVSRSEWERCEVTDGDALEILHAIGGGA